MSNPFATAKPALPTNPITENQENYLRALLLRKAAVNGQDPDEALRDINTWISDLSKSEAHDEIDKTKLWLDDNKKSVEIDDGFYTLAGVDTPIRVIHAIHGSGYQYARALDPDTRKWNVQLPGLLNRVATSGVRIDTDHALATDLGKLYGICMVCGTTLTDSDPGGSIELGIGPVCRSRRGW